MKKVFLFIFLFMFFSFLIFFIKNTFFWGFKNEHNNYIEENFIEPTVSKDEYYLNESEPEEKNKIRVALKSAYKIDFIYIPRYFSKNVLWYTNVLKFFLNSAPIRNKIDTLKVELYKDKWNVRWKMKFHRIKLFWIEDMSFSEYLSVWIHEFAHFIDLYYFEKKVFTDISDYFYIISWESTKVMKPWLKQSDFVSGYSMTNKYEDFAESFTYFILHNGDFLEKSKKSDLLKAKYDFFNKFLFRDNEFDNSDYSEWNKVKSYYRDITKIEFSLKKFLIFLKN